MRFLNPWMLLLAPFSLLLVAVAFALLRRGNARLRLFATPAVLFRSGLAAKEGEGAVRFGAAPFVQLALLAAGLVLLAVAAARPQWGRTDVHLSSRGRSLLIALDVSRSMLAEDVRPNRLERAKVDILDLIADLKGDRAGILVFRGKGLMLCPLTADYAFLRQAVDGITVDSAPRGSTDIADALTKCLDALKGAEEDNCAILLISDGEDLAGYARRAAEEAGRRNVPVFTVGIGDPSGAPVPSPDGSGPMRFGGKDVSSRLTEKTLREIADASGGVYIPLATSGTAATTLGAIYRQHLTRLAARELDEMLENRFVERYQLFLIPGLLLLLAAAALSKGRPAATRRHGAPGGRAPAAPPPLPGASAAIAVLAVSLLLPAAASTNAPALASPRDARIAYNAALEAYQAGDATNAAALIRPFSANADFPEAAELYAAARFNLASDLTYATNAAAKAELLEDAAAAFQTALSRKSGDERRQRNLARAVDPLPALRAAAHREAVLAEKGSVPSKALTADLLALQRALFAEAESTATNASAAARIEGFESLAERQREASDLLIALREALAKSESFTNEQLRAAAMQEVEAADRDMRRSADALDDVNAAAAADPLALSENAAFGLWRHEAEPPDLLQEAILCETNVVVSPDRPKWPLRDDSETALDVMKRFSERFPEWARRKIEEDAQRRQQTGDTNAPPFTEESIAQINELLESSLWLLEDNCKLPAGEGRVGGAREAHGLLGKIAKLIPVEQPPPPQQQNPDNQQTPSDQQNSEQNEDQSQSEQQEQRPEEQQEKEEAKKPPEQKEEPPPDVQEALRRAIQREREHEDDKKRRRREFPLPPNARDW